MQLLQLLSTSKAALRCLAVAEGCGLRLPLPDGTAAAQQRQRFVDALLCKPYGSTCPPGASHRLTGLRLLWQLVVCQPGACASAAPRACAILLWCLAPPFPELQQLLSAQAADACPAEELARQLCASQAGGVHGTEHRFVASPYWQVRRRGRWGETEAATLSCCSVWLASLASASQIAYCLPRARYQQLACCDVSF